MSSKLLDNIFQAITSNPTLKNKCLLIEIMKITQFFPETLENPLIHSVFSTLIENSTLKHDEIVILLDFFLRLDLEFSEKSEKYIKNLQFSAYFLDIFSKIPPSNDKTLILPILSTKYLNLVINPLPQVTETQKSLFLSNLVNLLLSEQDPECLTEILRIFIRNNMEVGTIGTLMQSLGRSRDCPRVFNEIFEVIHELEEIKTNNENR